MFTGRRRLHRNYSANFCGDSVLEVRRFKSEPYDVGPVLAAKAYTTQSLKGGLVTHDLSFVGPWLETLGRSETREALSLSISISIYIYISVLIYIYVHTYRKRARERNWPIIYQ